MINDDNIEVKATLKLDTEEARKQLSSLPDVKVKASTKPTEVALPKDQKIALPKEAAKSFKKIFTGDKGIANIGKVARGAMGGIRGIAGSLGTLLPVLGVVAVAIMAITKLLQGTDTMEMMMSSFSSIFDTLRTVLAPILSVLGEVISAVADIIVSLLPILEPVVAVIRMLIVPVLALLLILKPIVNLFMKLWEVFSTLASIFTGTLMGVFESVLNIIVALIDTAIKPLLAILDLVIAFFETIKDVIQNFITALTFGLIRFDTDVTSTNASKVGKTKTSLDTWETSANDSPVKSAQYANEAAAKSKQVVESLLKVLTEIGKLFSTIWNWSKDVFTTISSAVVETFTGFWDWIVTAVKAVIDGIGGFIGGIFKGIGKVAGGIWGGIQTVFGKGWLYENGGTLDAGAQIWGMSEQGNPEFLFNSGGHNTVVNADILEDAMYNAFIRANGGKKAQEIKVTIKEGTPAGPRELVQWILPSLKFVL